MLLYSQPVEKASEGANWVTPRCPGKNRFAVSLFCCKITCEITSPCMFYVVFIKGLSSSEEVDKTSVCSLVHSIAGIYSQNSKSEGTKHNREIGEIPLLL